MPGAPCIVGVLVVHGCGGMWVEGELRGPRGGVGFVGISYFASPDSFRKHRTGFGVFIIAMDSSSVCFDIVNVEHDVQGALRFNMECVASLLCV
jgi:hypothetical protein